jgi:hypothetical protein
LWADNGHIIAKDFYIEFVGWVEEVLGVAAVEVEAG